MKKTTATIFFVLCTLILNAQISDVKQVVKDEATYKVNANIQGSIDNAANKTESAVKGFFKKKDKTKNQQQPLQLNETVTNTNSSVVKTTKQDTSILSATNSVAFKAYNNYDFVPGDTILFEDHFVDDQEGEFPAHWKLIQGQGVINKVEGDPVFAFNQTSIVTPLMKKQSYLPNQYTIEYDFYVSDSYGGLDQIHLLFDDKLTEWTEGKMNLNTVEQSYTINFSGGQLVKALGEDISLENYLNKWHHIAIAVKDKQIKIYLDQNRLMTVPNCNYKAGAIGLSINGSDNHGLIGFKNFRLAKGGGMNMLGKKFTDTKIITHGINFDVDRATIKPESMGTLNSIVQILKDNPDLKFEVGGHTDNTGTSSHNLMLSQQRADAVKNQLVSMGIDAARLTTKGYGDAKPISDNNTLEGKANNRRVEFVKQ